MFFTQNEFEDNINQFFGGANPGGSGQRWDPVPHCSGIYLYDSQKLASNRSHMENGKSVKIVCTKCNILVHRKC